MRTLVLFAALATPASAQDAPARRSATDFAPEHRTQIAAAGQLAGEIQACELEWESYYLAYMRSERRRAENEGFDPDSEAYGRRVAVIGAFFGAIQGREVARRSDEPCPLERLPVLSERMKAVLDTARARETTGVSGSE